MSAFLVTFVLALCALENGARAQYVNPGPSVFISLPPQPINQFRNQSLTRACEPHAYDVLKSHSCFWGCRNRTDRVLFAETVDKPGRFFTTREKILAYPGEVPQGHVRNEIITAIWCYDLVGNNAGGYCNIQSGGVGKTHVRLHLSHPLRNMPLRFRVEIYGNSTQIRY